MRRRGDDYCSTFAKAEVSVPAQYSNLLTGYASLEELIRSLSYAHTLHRTEGVPFDYANITDVPSVTWSYPSILNAAGIRYFAEATNSDRGPIVLYGKWNEKSPFWREGPDGSKILMANTRQYSQLWFVCDLPPDVGNCRQGLPAYLQQFSAPEYKPDAVLMFGSQLENTDARLSEPEFIANWNATYAYPKFILSTFPDYFRYIERKYGSQLATVSGDGGPVLGGRDRIGCKEHSDRPQQPDAGGFRRRTVDGFALPKSDPGCPAATPRPHLDKSHALRGTHLGFVGFCVPPG